MANYNSYAEDVQRYLVNKFPNEDESRLLEVSEYIGHRTARLILEVIEDRDKEWKCATRKHYIYKQKQRRITMAISNIPTEERLGKEFDQIMQTIIGDKDRIIKTMLDRCMSAEIYIPFEPLSVPHYQITFTHTADITND